MNQAPDCVQLNGARVVHHDGVAAEDVSFSRGMVTSNGTPAFNVDLRDHLIFPGLINAHDHLQLNNVPSLEAEEPFGNSYEWIAAIEAHRSTPSVIAATSVPRGVRHWHGALKNILSGVTTVAHHDPWTSTLDELDFPVHTPRIGWCHSLRLGADDGAAPQYGPPVRRSFDDAPPDMPWIIHLAEGIDGVARRELGQLAALGCLASNTVLVHGVALTSSDIDRIVARDAAVVWCPSSNLRLFGCTLDVGRLDDAGRVALGTDSRLTGSRDLLDELRVAADRTTLSSRALLRMVTDRAAAILRLTDRGRLAPGARADCVIVRGGADPYESLLGATRGDLRAVVRNGAPVIADPDFAEWFAHAGVATTSVVLDGRPKLLARAVARREAVELEPGLEMPSIQ